ncbi:cytochrome c551 peroxidase [Filimonas sp.]|nr:cytochrome c551 peroxidase [Filimonas sp.]
MKKILVFSVIASAILIAGCRKNTSLSESAFNETPTLPSIPFDYNARFQHLSPFGEVLNNEVAALGRVLFYERKLSANGTVSCGSCHMQSNAFADNKKSSSGLALGKTPRNSPTLCNISRQNRYFLDGRDDTLEQMVLKPIGNHLEMGISDIASIVNRVESISYYKPLFEKAFGDDKITLPRIATSLKTFLNSIVSYQSKQDLDPAVPIQQLYTFDERVGRQLFMMSLPCASCHTGDNLTLGWSGSTFANIGLEEHYTDKGATFMNSPQNGDLEGFFKVPTLRNIALTAPYMHDGRFKTLDDVITFYTQNIQPHPLLNSNLQTGGGWGGGFGFGISDPEVAELAKVTSNNDGKFGTPLRFELNSYQRKCLIAFLHTFTDTKMITEPMYSDPFKK